MNRYLRWNNSAIQTWLETSDSLGDESCLERAAFDSRRSGPWLSGPPGAKV